MKKNEFMTVNGGHLGDHKQENLDVLIPTDVQANIDLKAATDGTDLNAALAREEAYQKFCSEFEKKDMLVPMSADDFWKSVMDDADNINSEI